MEKKKKSNLMIPGKQNFSSWEKSNFFSDFPCMAYLVHLPCLQVAWIF